MGSVILHVWRSWEEPGLGGTSQSTNQEVSGVKSTGFMQVLESKCVGQALCLNKMWQRYLSSYPPMCWTCSSFVI